MAPAIPPKPTTEPTACRGNMSDTSVKRFADQPWCAAAATPMSVTATQRSLAPDAKTIGTTASAQTSIAVLRPALTRPAALDERRRQPAAADAADVGDEIDRDERRADGPQVDAVIAIEEVRDPEEVQPPDRIGQELADRKRPRLAVRHAAWRHGTRTVGSGGSLRM